MKSKKICVVCGGQSSEREVSLRTGKAVYSSLLDNGYSNAFLLDLDFAKMDIILEHKPDVCFNALHGKVGEDGVLQDFLDNAGIAYTGSGAKACRLSFDKQLSKEVFIKNSIPTPEYKNVDIASDLSDFLPCVIKPANEGSTIGITIADTVQKAAQGIKDALKLDNKVIAEKFISGKELTVSVFEDEIFPIIWIKPKSGFYDYNSKYTAGATEYIFDTGFDVFTTKKINDTAHDAYKVLGCSGVSRVDIIYDGETPYVLEVNTAPGMTETSLLPKAAARAGIDFIHLIEKMLYGALGKLR